MAGIRCLQERRCWRTRGKSAGSCKTPDVVAWKSSSPCPSENDGPCLGTARGMDSAPLWGSQLQGSPLPCHCPTQPPSLPSGPHHLPRAPVPPHPGARAGTGQGGGWPPRRKPQHPAPTLFAPTLGDSRAMGWGCSSGNQGCGVALADRAVRRECVCVCVGGVLCFSVSNSCQSRGTVSENTKVLI